jgi:putative MFS transporter
VRSDGRPSMNWLIAARFLMGIRLGAEIVVGYLMAFY